MRRWAYIPSLQQFMQLFGVCLQWRHRHCRLVSPCAVTDGVTLLFSLKKLTTFSGHRSQKVIALIGHRHCHHLPRVPFLKFSYKNCLLPGCHPLDGVTPGGPPPPSGPLVTLLSVRVYRVSDKVSFWPPHVVKHGVFATRMYVCPFICLSQL